MKKILTRTGFFPESRVLIDIESTRDFYVFFTAHTLTATLAAGMTSLCDMAEFTALVLGSLLLLRGGHFESGTTCVVASVAFLGSLPCLYASGFLGNKSIQILCVLVVSVCLHGKRAPWRLYGQTKTGT
jgi:hypothetical protein